MRSNNLSAYFASFEDGSDKAEHKIEVHFQDTEKDKYRKETFDGKSLPSVVDDAIERVNEIAKDKNKELKFIGFPSHN